MGKNAGRAKRQEIYRPVNPQRIGEVIRRRREQAGLSQHQLAALLLVNQSLVSRWERGTRIPGGPELLDLMVLLEISRDDIT